MGQTCRIIIVSDNHGDTASLKELKNLYPDADYFLHLGDSEMNDYDLEGFVCVRGNNDWDTDFPEYQTVNAGGHRIFMCHGNRDMYTGHYERLAEKARSRGCDIACFGHTHIYHDSELNGVRLLNPGSIRYTRDGSEPSYMEMILDEEGVHVQRMTYSRHSRTVKKAKDTGRSFWELLFGKKKV